jgi:hypothetical protein
MAATWAFFVEPLAPSRCRLVSRFRVDCPDDLGGAIQYDPALVEPIGFVMDRRMLRGIKERVERRGREVLVDGHTHPA